MSKQIKIVVEPGKSPIIEVDGVEDESCHEASKPFIDAAGEEEECTEKEYVNDQELPDYVENM